MIGRDYSREGFNFFPTLVPDETTWDTVGKRLRRRSVQLLREGKFPLGYFLHGMATRAERGTIYQPGPPRQRRIKRFDRLIEHVSSDGHPVLATLAASERAGGQVHA
jgi:hypothetical protein